MGLQSRTSTAPADIGSLVRHLLFCAYVKVEERLKRACNFRSREVLLSKSNTLFRYSHDLENRSLFFSCGLLQTSQNTAPFDPRIPVIMG
jgi:hypothetical protein